MQRFDLVEMMMFNYEVSSWPPKGVILIIKKGERKKMMSFQHD